MKYILSVLLCFLVLLSGCAKTPSDFSTNSSASSSDKSLENDSSKDEIISDMFSAADYEVGYNEEESAVITLSGNSASCSSGAVTINGDKITITDEGTYIFSGEFNGMITVNCDKTDKVRIVLNNASIKSDTCAPLYVLSADKVFVTLAPDSVNSLSNGGEFTSIDENNIDAVIFSKEDLTLNGSGVLKISSPAGHGIVSKDELAVTSGNYEIECLSHGIVGKDSIAIANASFNITSGKDGIHAENKDDDTLGFVYIESGSFDIISELDGISAASYMSISGGSFNIVSGGGSESVQKAPQQGFGPSGKPPMFNEAAEDTTSESTKALKAGTALTISGGDFKINSADDAVHSNSDIEISAGSFQISTGDDGFHADDTIRISSGNINISESYEGIEALCIEISGGDITLTASDDGINAAGGKDESGFAGILGNDMFGQKGGKFGPGGGMPGSSSSNGSLIISGGNINITAYGDGIDANGSIEISGGYIFVCGPTTGDTSTIDYDTNCSISGGTFIGTGASRMAQSFSSSSAQGSIFINVGSVSDNTSIEILSSSGAVFSHTPSLGYEVVIFSSPDIVKGETYTLNIGGKEIQTVAR